MSDLVEIIDDIIDDIIEVVDDVVTGIVEGIWDEIVMPALEIVAGVFGIEDQTVVNVQLVSQKLYPDSMDLESDAITKIAVEHTKNPDVPLTSAFIKHAFMGSVMIDGYYTFAESGAYPYELPTSNIKTSSINKSAIVDALNIYVPNRPYGTPSSSPTLITVTERHPSKEEYYKHYLQDNFSYHPWSNTLTYTDAYGTWTNYALGAITYNAGNNTYSMPITRIRPITTFYLSGPSEVQQGNTTTSYTISIDRPVPSGNTVTVNLAYTGSAVNGTHYTGVSSVVIPANSTTATFTIGTTGGVLSSGSVSMAVSISSISTQTSFELTSLAVGKSSITTNITWAAANSVQTDNTTMPSASIATISTTLSYSAYPIKVYVIATYWVTSSSEWRYWLYDLTTNTFPEVRRVYSTVTNLEMMPIGILRESNETVSVATEGQANYDGTVALLDTLDLNFEDIMTQVEENPDIANVPEVFLTFAVNPTDTSKVVSKILYEMFYGLVTTQAVNFNSDLNDEGYYATFIEQNVKKALVWSTQSASTQALVIGSVGTYNHSVTSITTLTMRKQINPTTCSVIVLNDLSGIDFIAGNGNENMSVSKLGNSNFTVLISNFSVNSLTPLEQIELLNASLRLNFYGVTLTHLEWYETSLFASFMEFILIVIAVITFNPATLGKEFFIKIISNYIIMTVAIAIINTIDNDFLKAVVAAVAVYLTFQTGGGSTLFSDPASVLNAVTTFSDILTADINSDLMALREESARINDEFNTRSQEIAGLIEAQESGLNPTYLAYLRSPDTLRYMAGPMQYDFSSFYNYDTLVGNYHDNALILGVV